MGGIRIGIDVGGTFTDFVLLDPRRAAVAVGKTLTTPRDPTVGILTGLSALLDQAGVRWADVRTIVHGTTLVTNTVIERKGAATGLLTTAGHRDVLEIGNELRYDLDDLFLERPQPLVPRYLRKSVGERITARGEVLQPVPTVDLESAAAAFRRHGVQAVAVCLLHAYANPDHELAIRAAMARILPEADVVLSSEVAPEIREYERTCTTVLNAYVKPVMKRYISDLEHRLQGAGFAGNLYIMLSSGGISTVSTAGQFPIRLLESGPAAGVLAAAHYGHTLGSEECVVSFDMGGTTAKISVVDGGRPSIATVFETDRVHRFRKGSGLPVKVPAIDMIEIGAGGGSIARVDAMGLLKVGPESAGADPGPACYGFGGDRPTVTDADLVLGYLHPGHMLGGGLKLDMDRARRALEQHVARPLGLDAVQAAVGIYEIVNENMASAAKIHIAERGCDRRRYALVAFGGAGPVHAFRLARLLQMKQVIFPPDPGTFSALGLLASPTAFDFVRSYVARLDQVDWGKAEGIFREMEDQGRSMVMAGGVAPEQITIARSVDMRYVGQGHEVAVALPPAIPAGDPAFSAAVQQRFFDSYKRLFGRYLSAARIEILSLRVVVSGPKPDLAAATPGATTPVDAPHAATDAGTSIHHGWRQAYFRELGGFHETPVYQRQHLPPGLRLTGPAIIEENNSTLVVGPDAAAMVAASGSIVVTL